jgi:uncharacterized protein with von Willebrand factor type A (vWA) domain
LEVLMGQIDLDLSFYFKAFQNKSKAVNSVVKTAKDKYGMEFSADLASDVFNALYQKDPHLVSVDDPTNKYSQAIRAVLNSGQFLSLRSQTAGSLSWSAIGASLIIDQLAKTIDFSDIDKPQEKQPELPDDPIENENAGDEQCDMPQPSDSQDSDDDKIGKGKGESEEQDKSDDNSQDKPEDSGDLEENDESAQDNSRDAEKPTEDESSEPDTEQSGDSGDEESPEDKDSEQSDANSEPEDNEGEGDSDDGDESADSEPERELDEQNYEPVSPDIQRAINEAGENLDNIMKGLSAGAGDSVETFSDSIDLAELYTDLATNPELSELIQLVGKLRLNTNFLPAMTVGEPEEVSEVILGDEIEKTLPFDIGLMMGNDEEFMHFHQKLSNAELTQYETVTHKQPGAGPMIVCVDYSGSMTAGLAGSEKTREQWAKSLAIAIYIQAIKEKRPYAIIPFADFAELHVPKYGRMDVEFMKKIQNVYVGGGTEFQPAWDKAINFITADRDGKDFRDADIIFITDGMGSFSYPTVTKTKADHNIRLVTIFLGASRRTGAWAELSDAMCFVSRLTPGSEAEAFKIVKNHELGERTLS